MMLKDNLLQHPGDEDYVLKERVKSGRGGCCFWMRRNAILLLLILVACAGIALSCLFYFRPCPKVKVESPVDIVLAFDGSGSVRSGGVKFPKLMDSGRELVSDLATNLTNSTFQVGVTQWASRSPRIELNLTSNMSRALKSLDKSHPYPILKHTGTWFATALATCGVILLKSNSPDPYQMCVVFSDGLNGDANFKYSATAREFNTPIVLDYCNVSGIIDDCTTASIASSLKRSNVTIMSMYIGTQQRGEQGLCGITDCNVTQCTSAHPDACDYFAIASNFDQVKAKAEEISEAVLRNVPSKEACYGSPLWFFFLALIAPFALYLLWRPLSLCFSRFCCNRHRNGEKPVPLDRDCEFCFF